MARSMRVFYTGQQGRSRKNLNWSPITKKSAVYITAAEWHPPGGFGGLEDIRPHLGEANISVTNIGVHGPEGRAAGVEFHLHVDWSTPLNVMVTVTVLDEIEQYVRA
jgi:hypothetical protein